MHHLLVLFAGLAFIGAGQEVQSHHPWGFAVTFGLGVLFLLLHGDVQRKLGSDPTRPLVPGRHRVVGVYEGGGESVCRVVLMRHLDCGDHQCHEHRLAEIPLGYLPRRVGTGDTIIVERGEQYYSIQEA